MFMRLFVSMPFATKHCKETPAIPKLRENYFQPAAGENFLGGAEVARPDMRNISYLGHSVTWDKSGILGANHLLGPSQDSARALYGESRNFVLIISCCEVLFVRSEAHGQC